MYNFKKYLIYILYRVPEHLRPYVFFLVILFVVLIIIIIIMRTRRKKEIALQEDAVGSYYSDLSTDDILSCLKNIDIPKSDTDIANRFMELNRIVDEEKKKTITLENKLNDFMQMQGTISENILKIQDENSRKLSDINESINKKIASVEQSARSDDEKARQETADTLSFFKNKTDQIEKDIIFTRTSLRERKVTEGADYAAVFKNQEILSERLSTINEHLTAQKDYFEKKLQIQQEHDRKLLGMEKDINIAQTEIQSMQLYIHDQFEQLKHETQISSGTGMKEFGDLIKEKMSNFFEERTQQLQKMEIQMDELKNMDTVKQNVLMRLQKEFSERLTDINLRITDQKKNLSEQLLHSETGKKHLLELEKAITELRLALQGKQTQFYNKQDIRVQELDERIKNISRTLDEKSEDINEKQFTRLLEKHTNHISVLTEEFNKLKQIISVQQSAVTYKDSSEDVEHQIKELKGMVYSLIDSLKE